MDELWSHVGISTGGILGVVIASAVLYLVYSAVLAVWGPRLFSSSSTLSNALLTVLGSLCARAMLGEFPTLGGAIVATAILLVLESIFGRLRRREVWGYERHRPRGVIVDGKFVYRPQRQRVTSEAELLNRLRASGVRRLEDAAPVFMESRGKLTVLRAGDRIDTRLLDGVIG